MFTSTFVGSFCFLTGSLAQSYFVHAESVPFMIWIFNYTRQFEKTVNIGKFALNLLYFPDILCESSKANIARDLLLQKVSHVLQCPDVAHWGPACNRAVREEFPNSIAQRKGKFKKYPLHNYSSVIFTYTCNQLTDLGHFSAFSILLFCMNLPVIHYTSINIVKL